MLSAEISRPIYPRLGLFFSASLAYALCLHFAYTCISKKNYRLYLFNAIVSQIEWNQMFATFACFATVTKLHSLTTKVDKSFDCSPFYFIASLYICPSVTVISKWILIWGQCRSSLFSATFDELNMQKNVKEEGNAQILNSSAKRQNENSPDSGANSIMKEECDLSRWQRHDKCSRSLWRQTRERFASMSLTKFKQSSSLLALNGCLEERLNWYFSLLALTL